MDNYVQLLEKIAEYSKLTVQDIERKVEAKRAKLSGLVSKEGAAQIVAAELGINFEKERMKISELVEGMKKANIVGKVMEILPVRGFNKNGREGKIGSMMVADKSSNVRVVLWDTNHINLLETNKVNVGDNVEISNAGFRNGELHLSSFSDIKLSKEDLGEVNMQKVFSANKIRDAKPGQGLKTRAVIVQLFDPRYFEVCPDCNKRVLEESCQTHGKVKPLKRALLNVVLDDGTETIRSVMFGEQINRLGLTNEQIFSLENFALKKEELLGEEKIFAGKIRTNSLYNTTEFTIDSILEVEVNELIKELEAR